MSVRKPKKQSEVRDPLVKSLISMHYISGRVAYYIRSAGNDRKRILLGHSDSLTLDQARLAAIEAKSANPSSCSRTLSSVFGEYSESGKYSGRRSVDRDCRRFESVVEPLLGHLPVQSISLADIHEVMASLKPTLSAATRNRYLAMIRSIFRFAVEHGYCEKDPTRSIRLARETPVKLYEVNDELLNRLGCAVEWLEERFARTAFLVQLLLLTGMRLNEALSLAWDDVDISARHIRLRTTKGGRLRHVPISEACMVLLERLAEAEFSQAPQGWLFPSAYSDLPMTRPVRPWKRACRAVGLPVSLRFHDLRHIFAAASVKDGIPLFTLQQLLGHSSIRMTERYASLAREDLLVASDRVSRALTVCAGGVE